MKKRMPHYMKVRHEKIDYFEVLVESSEIVGRDRLVKKSA